ncbi:hypothetical protein ABZP36_007035, partial [Zizania latifolia]
MALAFRGMVLGTTTLDLFLELSQGDCRLVPAILSHLRKLFSVDSADYMLAICGNDALRELSSPGTRSSEFDQFLLNGGEFLVLNQAAEVYDVILYFGIIDILQNYNTFDEELETGELDEIFVQMKSSIESDPREAAVWHIFGLVLLRSGQFQSVILVLSSLTAVAPDYLDSLANLGIAYIQSGNLELAAKCFQELILKDQNHPAALVNYAAFLLCKYGSLAAGGNVSAGSYLYQKEGLAVAKECLLAAVKADPKAASAWINLANAYYMAGEHKNSRRCLEQAARHEPSHMPARYAISVHRIRDVVRLQSSDHQLLWAIPIHWMLVGDLVLAKIKGFPAWLAMVSATNRFVSDLGLIVVVQMKFHIESRISEGRTGKGKQKIVIHEEEYKRGIEQLKLGSEMNCNALETNR